MIKPRHLLRWLVVIARLASNCSHAGAAGVGHSNGFTRRLRKYTMLPGS